MPLTSYLVLTLISAWIVLLALNKPFCDAAIKEWTKARTIYTAAFYGVFLYCILEKIPVPPELNTIISTLFGYWFGAKTKKEGGNEEK